MMKERLNFKIGKDQANIQQRSIEVSAGTKELHIDTRLPEELRYMGFVIVKDCEENYRMQKLLGYGEQNLCIGTDGMHTTIGGAAGELKPGTWTLMFGIFTEYVKQKMGDREAEVEITVTQVSGTDEEKAISDPVGSWCWTGEGTGLRISDERYLWDECWQQEPGWYKGDFHTHTRLSDGKETVANAMKKAKDMEMDFYVPTEHNLMHTGWCSRELCILPGIEITTDDGHFNLFGITEMPERLLDIVTHNGEEIVENYVQDTIEEAHRKNWIVSINHPFLTIWKWKYADTRLSEIDCIEIINDPTYQDAPGSNDMAVKFMDVLWADGHRIFGVGGSDSHNLIDERYEGAELPSIAGDPGTYVYCEKLTPNNLMDAVRKGHICVTRFCRVLPSITAQGKSYLPGDEIYGTGNEIIVTYSAEILGLKEKPDVFFIVNGEYIKVSVENISEERYRVWITFSFETEIWQWARMEIRDKRNNLLGIVNPIYHGTKNSKYETFGQAVKALEETERD